MRYHSIGLKHSILIPLLLALQLTLEGGVSAAQQLTAEEQYREALQAIDRREYQQAEQILQNLIAHHPNHAGGWLDFAIVSYRNKKYRQSELAFRQIEERFSPSAALQQLINYYRKGWSETAQWQPLRLESEIGLQLGYGNNINAGVAHSNRTIQLGDAIMELNDERVAQQDSYLEWMGVARATTQNRKWMPFLNLGGVERHYMQREGLDHRVLFIGGGVQYNQRIRQLEVALHQTELHIENQKLMSETAWTLGDHHQLQPWSRAGAEIELARKRYQQQENDASQLTLRGYYQHTPYRLEGEIGEDKAINERAGGEQWWWKIRAEKRFATELGELAVMVEHGNQQDQAPYSQRLFGETKREIDQSAIIAQLQKEITKKQRLRLAVGYNQNRSNIPLFANQGIELTLGISWLL